MRFNDLDGVVTAVTAYNPAASTAATEQLLNNALNNLLLGVLPVTAIEEAAGQSGIVSGQVGAGIDQVTGAIGMGLDALFDPLLAQGLDGAAAPLLDPIENQVIHLIFGQINDAIGSIGSGPGTGLPSTPLDAILGPLTGALGSGALPSLPGVPGAGGTGTPLDILLNPLLGALSGAAPGGGSGGGSPLDALTGLLSPVLTALSPVLAPVLGAPASQLVPALQGVLDQLTAQLTGGPLSPATAPLSALLLTVLDSVNDLGLDDAAMETVINPILEQLLGAIGQLPLP